MPRPSQGWCPFILDYNGDGVIGRYTEPDEPFDPKLDRRTGGPTYGIIPNPADGSVWFAQPDLPGRIVRLDAAPIRRRPARPKSMSPRSGIPRCRAGMGFTPRGIAADR